MAMARVARRAGDDGVYHVLNRGNCRMDIFTKPGDFAAFIKLLEEARRRTGMRILGYCLMNNHWHLVLWPKRGADLSRFIGWLCTTHVRRWRAHRGDAGEGHVYRGRFKSFLVERDEHFLTLMSYVEGNRFRAGLVRRAEDWPWSSLGAAAGADGVAVEMTSWPVDRPRNWLEVVNRPIAPRTAERIRTSIARSRPFGDEKWVQRMVKHYGLDATVRNPWRPSKPRTR
jgi:putative transposase